jgi:5-methylthioadenosine/S-adenosylhomocysteine deaminase
VAVLPRWLRVRNALDYVQGVHPSFNRERAEQFLSTTDVQLTHKVRQLSKGMVTQLHLALVLAIRAKLLVLDEPTLGLDLLVRRRFYDTLLNDYMDEERTILITTHQVEEIQDVLTDLIFIDLSPINNMPAFSRDAHSLYAQFVYASKSTDVLDVMCNGRWLMRNSALLTLDESGLRDAADDYARRIDAFLAGREESVLQKLVAIGGAIEQESFEVQVKAHLASDTPALAVLDSESITVIRSSHYHQFDTYWSFSDPEQGRLRYREDEFLDNEGKVTGARARLTLTGRTRKESFGGVLLFHSRYLAPAAHSARFYREYFRPAAEHVVEKERRRWLIAYRGVEFHVHLDRLITPSRDGYFLEIKSRTWSRRDAVDKAEHITRLLELFGTRPDDTLPDGYVEFATGR